MVKCRRRLSVIVRQRTRGRLHEVMAQCLQTTTFSSIESTIWGVISCECEQRGTGDSLQAGTCTQPPACLKESDLGWCQRGEWSGPHGMQLTGYERFQCHYISSSPACAVEYKCTGGACAPAGRYLSSTGGTGGAGTYGNPVVQTGNWIDIPSHDPNVKCCGHKDSDVVWDVPKNIWVLFGLTWAFLVVVLALSFYQHLTGAQTRTARMSRAHSRGVFLMPPVRPDPVLHPNVVVVPNPQSTDGS